MSDRGIKKWAPYKSLTEQDFTLKGHKEKEEIIEKPKISADFAEEINDILINYQGELLIIEYYYRGKILSIIDRIKKIDSFEKKLILFSRKTVVINDIVSIKKSEGDEL